VTSHVDPWDSGETPESLPPIRSTRRVKEGLGIQFGILAKRRWIWKWLSYVPETSGLETTTCDDVGGLGR
jgi:hypothetical protein